MTSSKVKRSTGARPRLLDLFCGAGGAAMGYHRAGFDVVGVDVVRQPHYPFPFVQADALWVLDALSAIQDGGGWPTDARFDPDIFDSFDAIHASPPCKLFTPLRAVRRPTLFEPHLDLLTPTRDALRDLGIPYVIENVPGAPMAADAAMFCGSSFGLGVRRHRMFESDVALAAPACRHDLQPHPVGVYGNGGAWTRTAPGGGGRKVAGADAAEALGIDWTEHQPALSQAIPPAYTEHIGRQLMAHITSTEVRHAA